MISYKIVATNDGNMKLSGVTVTDTGTPPLSSFTCLPTNPANLEPGQSIGCEGTHTIT